MTSAFIRTRTVSDGTKRYIVVYRRGGRMYRQESAGTFRQEKHAKVRRDLVAGWLAQGLDPKAKLAELAAPAETAPRLTLLDAFDQWTRSRHDVAEKTREEWRHSRRVIVEFFGNTDAKSVKAADCRLFIAALVEQGYAPSTVASYFNPLQQTLDFLEVEPNPARHRTVRLPVRVKEEPLAMTRAQFHAWLERTPAKYRLFFRVLEATGMRVGELWQLQWGDVDAVESQFRISLARTKRRTGGQRWVPVPVALMEDIQDLLPLEDREAGRRVFRMVDSQSASKKALDRACLAAGIPHFSQHDLRHRRASLWHHQGIPDRVIQEWGGWRSRKVLNETYTHVVLSPRDDDWFGEAHRRLGMTLPTETREETRGFGN